MLRAEKTKRSFKEIARSILTVVALVGLALTGAITPASTASAALYNIFPADASGTPQNIFYADDALFATMMSDLDGGVVCLVPADIDPASENCYGNPEWGQPHTYIGMGTLSGRPFAKPPLKIGLWRLLITDLTGIYAQYSSDVFEVRPCQGECDYEAAMSQLQPWKSKAEHAMGSIETLEFIEAADKSMQMFNQLSGIMMDVAKGGGIKGVLIGIGTGMIEGIFEEPWEASKNLAMSILRPLHQTTSRMWSDIAADPPRFDYGVETQPVFTTVPLFR